MTPVVSILIPTYKRAAYLRAAIFSALAQTFSKIEVLILDDASPDKTPSVCAEFASDSRVRVLRHAQNVGIARNWQLGIENARGDFFCLLHDDDTLEPTFVEKLLAPLQADSALVLSFCDHWMTDENGARLTTETEAASRRFRRDALPAGTLPDFAHAALIDASLPVGASLFRRSLVTPDLISPKARGAIDLWLFLGCVQTGGGAFYIPERLMNYRSHGGGMSASAPISMGEGHIFRGERILADPSLVRLHPEIQAQMAYTLTCLGVDYLAVGDASKARRALLRALRLRPNARGIVTLCLACGGPVGTRAARAIRAGRTSE